MAFHLQKLVIFAVLLIPNYLFQDSIRIFQVPIFIQTLNIFK